MYFCSVFFCLSLSIQFLALGNIEGDFIQLLGLNLHGASGSYKQGDDSIVLAKLLFEGRTTKRKTFHFLLLVYSKSCGDYN